MTDRNQFENALIATKSIQTDVPSLSLNFIPYTKKYSASNFKNIPQIAKYLNTQGVRNTNNVYLARMPNLGHSCQDISENPELYRKYRELGTEVYCREILKLFRATRILNADFISFYISLMSFFLYISYYSVYFYSNLYYKHK